MSQITTLEPAQLWQYFDEILKIPRPSRKEEKIRSYLIGFAERHKLKYNTDDTGNLIITKDASKGFEHKKTIVLQSHLDMVCEKNSDSVHDFEQDPIIPVLDGEWIKASGTTLGADDGIGIASQMAILGSKDIEHPPIECLFTVDEESGLTGAMALQQDFFTGKVLLNLDSEDEGELFIGCAGGIDTIAHLRYNTRIFPSGHLAAIISVRGLKGGHSGDEIHKSPAGNSNKILNRFLWNAAKQFKIRISDFNGGNLRNAIPREATAIISVPAENWEDINHYIDEYSDILRKEISEREPDLKISIDRTETPETVINRKAQLRLLSALYGCPHGVVKWSDDIGGLVETSTNLASVKFMKKNTIEITTSQRSSVDSAKKDISDKVRALFEGIGLKVENVGGYPGWSPNPDSEIVKITAKSYQELFQTEPVIRAIHAGLECGLFLDKYPDLDMISFGPTIKRAHSPDEMIHIGSTEKYWKLLLHVLRNTG